jgi:2'-5' RNA ligase
MLPLPSVEIAHPGSVRDFRGTWWATLELPTLTERIRKWVSDPSNFNPDDVAPPSLGCKGGIETFHHINVLMGIPHAPSEEFGQILGSLTDPIALQFGALKTFEGAKGADDVYRVLVVEVIPNAQLFALQERIGRMAVKTDESPITWHHPKFNPHITVAFIKSECAKKYEGKPLLSDGETVVVKEITIKKYKSTESVSFPFRST